MVHVKVFGACSKDKSEAEIPYYELRQRAIDDLNSQISENEQIVSIKEEIGAQTVYPRMSNSDTWYTEKRLNLIVFFVKE